MFVQEFYGDAARFSGFDKKIGQPACHAIDLTTSRHGDLRLILKPDAWRLYRYLATDFYRKVSNMNTGALALKGTTSIIKGLKAGDDIDSSE
ncbi:DUF4225 domain-containing protein [Erwinia sp. 9145]|uniref:DUF4225 domain-containing protein n=1 Tax=Erwinia sp. 9145 TaxID=1500895 RepID=UPI000557ABFD|nr:DUF4225 domain-containing protein [Erwinia sp. 9145]